MGERSPLEGATASGDVVVLESVPWHDPDADALRTTQQAELAERYGGEGDLEPYIAPEGVTAMLLVRVGGVAAACGALRGRGEGVGELKRMFVLPAYRGRGLSRMVLGALERRAVDLGWERLILETGVLQPEAIGLYLSEGYTPMPNYPPYDTEADSRCFTKVLRRVDADADAGAGEARRPPRADVVVTTVPFDDPVAVGLRREMNLELAPVYPERTDLAAGFEVLDDLLGRGALATLVASVDGRPVGTVVLRGADGGFPADVGEVKRLYVRPEARSVGAARRLMSAIEDAARDHGRTSLVLQTGSRQPLAIALYVRHGYRAIAPYGPYIGDTVSFCFAKSLQS